MAASFLHVLLAAAVVMTVALVPGAQAAESQNSAPRSVIPLGRAVGIKLFAQGVLVVGLSDITTDQGLASPARACGLQEGDVITQTVETTTSTTPRSAPLRRSRPYSRTWKARKWN